MKPNSEQLPIREAGGGGEDGRGVATPPQVLPCRSTFDSSFATVASKSSSSVHFPWEPFRVHHPLGQMCHKAVRSRQPSCKHSCFRDAKLMGSDAARLMSPKPISNLRDT